MNKVILIGNVTKDPEIRATSNGVKRANFTLAVDRRFANAQGNREADFINIVAFGKAGEFAEKYLKKGMKILVGGRIQTGSYEKDGQKIYTTDVVAESQEFCESKKEDAPNPAADEEFMQVGDQTTLPF